MVPIYVIDVSIIWLNDNNLFQKTLDFQHPVSRHKTLANYDMPTVALRQNADIPQQRRRPNTNVGATLAADRDDADQCRRWANVAMLAGTWPSWHLKSPATPLFAEMLIKAYIKYKTKALCYWFFVVGIHEWLVDSSLKGAVTMKVFHVMKSSWHCENYPFHFNI